MGSAEQAREAILARIAELAPHINHPESLRHLAEALAIARSVRIPRDQRDTPGRATVA
jgi:hypothetical protein